MLKGRLNSNEVVPYFSDLSDPSMEVHSMFFHTVLHQHAPNATMAQPFRLMAHNASSTPTRETASPTTHRAGPQPPIIRPHGHPTAAGSTNAAEPSARDDLDLVTRRRRDDAAGVGETTRRCRPKCARCWNFSLYEEKNDGQRR